jgi:ATP-dependent Clp protease ATP-binding subunit ClpA
LEREKDKASQERLSAARKAIADVDDELQPLRAAYETEKRKGDEINEVRRKIDELRAKADEAERRYACRSGLIEHFLTTAHIRYDLATVSDLRYYALPDLQSRLEALQAKKVEEDVRTGGGTDTVTPEQIAEIVGRWTAIPVTRLMSTEKEKLLRLERILADHVVGQPEAVKAVANAIRLSRSGLADAQRPIASFLMAGPSGTGKTLLSKTVSWCNFIVTTVI